MENNQKTKKIFLKDIVIIILVLALIIVGFLFFKNTTNHNDLQTQIESLTTSNNELSSQIEENKTKIAELENNNAILQKEKETLETEKQQLENDKTELNSQIATLKKSSNANKTTSSVVGIWNTSLTTNEFSPDTHTSKEVTYTTTYEFKNNGDFYVNGNKVGTYKDNSIFFKDSNDPNYRTASYKLDNSILYVNLYQSNTDICVSTDFYKCQKK